MGSPLGTSMSPMGPSMSAPMGGSMPTSMGEISAMTAMSGGGMGSAGLSGDASVGSGQAGEQAGGDPPTPIIKKSRTNTPWSPAEEAMLRQKRDQGQTWGEIAKVLAQVDIGFPRPFHLPNSGN